MAIPFRANEIRIAISKMKSKKVLAVTKFRSSFKDMHQIEYMSKSAKYITAWQKLGI